MVGGDSVTRHPSHTTTTTTTTITAAATLSHHLSLSLFILLFCAVCEVW
ncbi:hypothetical protein OAV88_01090 [bacterium]|nr:hypothetical protein [bacterium]